MEILSNNSGVILRDQVDTQYYVMGSGVLWKLVLDFLRSNCANHNSLTLAVVLFYKRDRVTRWH